jgi:hypothetical protein
MQVCGKMGNPQCCIKATEIAEDAKELKRIVRFFWRRQTLIFAKASVEVHILLNNAMNNCDFRLLISDF